MHAPPHTHAPLPHMLSAMHPPAMHALTFAMHTPPSSRMPPPPRLAEGMIHACETLPFRIYCY